jgi:DeoR/GlpR family transcriptional regulator of sugar metabolism
VIASFKAQQAFVGATALSLEHGLSTSDQLEAGVKKKIIERAERLIIVADHTKIEKVGLIEVASLEQIDVLVTGREVPPEIVEKYRQRGIEVILA